MSDPRDQKPCPICKTPTDVTVLLDDPRGTCPACVAYRQRARRWELTEGDRRFLRDLRVRAE
jgi:hypothetical protein